MENFLKKIEASENNNPQLTAALQEIARLQGIISECRDIVDARFTHYEDEDGNTGVITFDQQNDLKVDILSNILN